MREYAEKIGAIDEYEKNGIISKEYLDYEKVVGKSTKAYILKLNKEHNMAGSDYRNKIATINLTGLGINNLYGKADNNTSSIIKAW